MTLVIVNDVVALMDAAAFTNIYLLQVVALIATAMISVVVLISNAAVARVAALIGTVAVIGVAVLIDTAVIGVAARIGTAAVIGVAAPIDSRYFAQCRSNTLIDLINSSVS